jgi:hypothetical protein
MATVAALISRADTPEVQWIPLQLGADHPNVASSLNNLANLYYVQMRYGEAEPLYMRALAIAEVSLGEEHPETKIYRNNLQLLRQR